MNVEEGKQSAMRAWEMSLLAALLVLLLRSSAALQITVHKVDCVYENVDYDGDRVSGSFVVVDHEVFWSSDHPGIDFTVTAPAGSVVHSLKGTAGDKFEFIAPRRGQYKFCFHNRGSAPETITFYIHVGHIPSEHDLAKDEHLDPVHVKIAELREALESISAEQHYLKARDARHRHTVESTHRRLIGYTLLEYLALILASASQVFLIRWMFNKRIGYNKL
eukprot:c15870_g1_i1 orf=520-1179(-)